jgi:hypothetical protein
MNWGLRGWGPSLGSYLWDTLKSMKYYFSGLCMGVWGCTICHGIIVFPTVTDQVPRFGIIKWLHPSHSILRYLCSKVFNTISGKIIPMCHTMFVCELEPMKPDENLRHALIKSTAAHLKDLLGEIDTFPNHLKLWLFPCPKWKKD